MRDPREGGVRVEVERERATIERIDALRSAGHTFRQIAELMIAEQRATKRGGRWRASTVQCVVAAERAARNTTDTSGD